MAEYAALADRVESQVNGVVRNCRLPPEADAQLHLVISDILDGAEMMRNDNGRVEGAIKLGGVRRLVGIADGALS